MNRHLLAVAICGTLFFFSTCRSRQQAAGQLTDSAATAGENHPVADGAITERLTDLGLTPNTAWRGTNLGDDFTHVRAVEKGEPFESDKEHIGYTIELKNLETADVLYYQTAGKVSAIDVDLFLNSRQSVADYQSELASYFTTRYGSPRSMGGGTVWTAKNGETVALKDVSKGRDYGLKLKIAPTGAGTSTASAK